MLTRSQRFRRMQLCLMVCLFTATGVPPSAMADRVFDAIRANQFYILSPKDAGWRRACEARLDDIRTETNPRFIQTTTND